MTHASRVAREATATRLQLATVRERATQLQMSTVLVKGLTEVVQQRGVSAQLLLRDSADRLLRGPAQRTLTLAELQALLERAIQLTREPALGLHWGLHASASSFGLVGVLVSHAPTLRRALELAARFAPLVGEGSRIELSTRLGVARLSFNLGPEHTIAGRGLVELMLAGLVRLLTEFGCARADIRAVCFEYTRPAHYPAYAHAFAGAERFAQDFTGIELSAEPLDRAHLHHDAELLALTLAQAQSRLAQHQRPRAAAEQVRELLLAAPLSRLPVFTAVARALGRSVRSLRRGLDAEGTSFSELTQALQHNAACSMLRDPHVTLQEVAHALGFSCATSFHRAFRRWAKQTPQQYRSEPAH